MAEEIPDPEQYYTGERLYSQMDQEAILAEPTLEVMAVEAETDFKGLRFLITYHPAVPFTGPKLYKWWGSMHHFRKHFHPPEEFILAAGGAHSNHLAMGAAWLPAVGIPYYFFMRGEAELPSRGNLMHIRELTPDSNALQYIPRSYWHRRWEWIELFMRGEGKQRWFPVKEGGFQRENALAMWRFGQHLRDMLEDNPQYENVFVEAGTGFTAATVLAALSDFSRDIFVHIVGVALTEAEQLAALEQVQHWFAAYGYQREALLPAWRFTTPGKGHRFGKTTGSVLTRAQQYFFRTGFFIDPVYGVHLMDRFVHLMMEDPQLVHKSLILHGGGEGSELPFTEYELA